MNKDKDAAQASSIRYSQATASAALGRPGLDGAAMEEERSSSSSSSSFAWSPRALSVPWTQPARTARPMQERGASSPASTARQRTRTGPIATGP